MNSAETRLGWLRGYEERIAHYKAIIADKHTPPLRRKSCKMMIELFEGLSLKLVGPG